MIEHQIDPPSSGMPGLKLIFLNGPPRAGKDTAGKVICHKFDDADVAKFAAPLKRMTHAMYNMPASINPEHYENEKDTPLQDFYGKTPRAAYIFTSENIIKPQFGQDFFGRLMLRTLWRRYQAGYRIIPITDSGFAPEAEPALDIVGRDKCLLIRIQAEGRGKTFAGDSRSYIELPGVQTVEVENNLDQTIFERAITKVVKAFLSAR